MKIQNPSLTLTFTSDNTTLVSYDIEQDSIQIVNQLYGDELAPSSNSVSLNLIPNDTIVRGQKTLAGNIISEDEDVKAVLKNGSTVLFTGFLGKDYSWTIGLTGEEVLKISLEDNGIHFLSNSFVDEDSTCFHDTALNLINLIITRCGNVFTLVTPTSEVSTILSKTLTNKVDSSASCEEVLQEICFELGLVYSFNTSGNLVITKTNLTATSSRTLWADNSSHTSDGSLYCYDSTAIQLSRSAKQYKQVKVSYSKLKDSTSNVDIYKVTSTPIEVPAQQWWDGSTHSEDIYELTLDEYFQSGKTYYTHDSSGYHVATVVVGDPITENTYYEYAGSASTVDLNDITNGKDIIYVYPNSVVPNLSGQTTALAGYVETTTGFGASKWTLKPHGNTSKLDVLIDNTLSPVTSVFYSKFQAKGRIITKLATCNIYRSAEGLTANTEIQYDYEANWIHEQADAVSLAELLNNYFLYANNQYVFYSNEDLSLGSVVSIKDNIFSGLDINIFLTSKSFTGSYAIDGVYKYTGQAVSAFSLKQKTRTENTNTPDGSKDGQDGEDAKVFDIALSNKTYSRSPRYSGNQTITLTAGIQGYSQTSCSISTDHGTLSKSSLTDEETATLTIPYVNDYDTINITATLGTIVKTFSLSVVKSPVTNVFLGVRSSLPTETEDGLLLISGDYFVVGSTAFSTYSAGSAWVYNGISWGTLTDPDKLLVCLNALKTGGVDLNTVGDQNTVSWFKSLVADKGVFNTLFSQNINVMSSGKIQSNGVQLDSAGQYPTNTGFVLGADGVLHSNGAYITGLNAVNGTFSGDFTSNAFSATSTVDATSKAFSNSGQLYGDVPNALVSLQGQLQNIGWFGYGNMTTCPSSPAITQIRLLDSSTYLINETLSGTEGTLSSYTATFPGTLYFSVRNPYDAGQTGVDSYFYISVNGENVKTLSFYGTNTEKNYSLSVNPGDVISCSFIATNFSHDGYCRVRTSETGIGYLVDNVWLTPNQYYEKLSYYTDRGNNAPLSGSQYVCSYTIDNGSTTSNITQDFAYTYYEFKASQFGQLGTYDLLSTSGASTGSLTFQFRSFGGSYLIDLTTLSTDTQIRINAGSVEVIQGGSVVYTIPNDLYKSYSVNCKVKSSGTVSSITITPKNSTDTLGSTSDPWNKLYLTNTTLDSTSFQVDSTSQIIRFANGIKIIWVNGRSISSGNNSISFTEAFSATPSVMATPYTCSTSTSYGRFFKVDSITNTGFNFWTKDSNLSAISFVAIGY